MKALDIEDIYPLSPLQQGMLFHDLYAPESKEYLVQICWTVTGPLDPEVFERAWSVAVERHPILRTEFAWEDFDEPLQVVYRAMKLPVDFRDWRGASEGEIDSRLKAFLEEDRAKGLDLTRVPLLRVSLLRVGEREFRFVWTFHHVLLDGWSLVRVLSEVLACCEAELSGRKVALAPSRPYRDYIAWLKKQDLSRAGDFWKEQLAGFRAPTSLQIENPYRQVDGDPYAEERLWLTEETSEALVSFARKHRMTLNTLFQGVWAVLLSRYSGDEDVVFGTTVSGRPPELEGMESMVGLFINTLPLRVGVRPGAPFLGWLEELQLQQAESRQFEYSPLWEVQAFSEIPRGTPLFESILVFENFPLGPQGKAEGSEPAAPPKLALSDIKYWTHTNYPLHLRVRPARRIAVDLNYDRRRFDTETVRLALGHLSRVLDAVLEDPTRKIAELPRLHETIATRDRRSLALRPGGSFREFPREALEGSIGQRFDDVASVYGDRLAVETENHRYTYQELARESWRIAGALATRGTTGDPVALLFEHGAPMLAAILGVLRAGRVYVPLDPGHPRERLLAILADSGATAIVTAGRCRDEARALAPDGVPVYDLDDDLPGTEAASLPDVPADSLAYILYTSGTTGEPKGAMQSHRNVLHHARVYTNALRIGAEDRLTLLSSYGFDASVMAIFGALLNGAALYPYSIAQSGMDGLASWVVEKELSLYHSTPTVYRYFVGTLGSKERRFPHLRAVVLGGEEVTRRDVGLYREHFAPGAVLVNGLGPTESTLALQYFIDDETELPGERVPVGYPVEDTELWLLNEKGERTELHGEIGIRSRYVALGYWNRPELTRERFLSDSEPGCRIYRTGDLGRLLPGGELEFLGRKDFQIKIRGMRVEPGAVEAFLGAHPGVKECVVLGRASGEESYLAAYVVPRTGETLSVGTLRSFLQQRLPSHMVPSSFVVLDSMPLTATGKLDRKRLPSVAEAAVRRHGTEGTFTAPRNPTEEVLCGIWTDVLGLEKVSVHDDFFALGGHSLRATQVVSRIRESFDVALPLRTLFEATTLAELAARIESGTGQARGDETITLLPRDRDLPVSFSQERLWFFDQMEPTRATYNIAGAIRLEGELDLLALERSLVEIVRRHETLRSSFRSVDGKPSVHIEPEDSFVLTVVSGNGHGEDELAEWLRAEAARPFELSRGPLLRCTLLRLGPRDHVLVLTTHHIVCDGWSLGILVRELGTLYRAFVQGAPSPLPELSVQYADFAAWQRSWLRGDELEAQIAYWKKDIGGPLPVLELPTDRPRPLVLTYRGAREPFRLSRELTEGLSKLSRQEDVTLFMTLLGAFNALLSRHTGQEDILVGSPIAGRSRVEVEPLIGCFVNTLALRTDLGGDPTFVELLARVRRKTLDAFAHQDLPFEKLVQELQPDRDASRNPLFQVVFALQNAPMGKLELPGLTARGVEVPSDRAHFDWTFTVVESGGVLQGALEYNTDLFDRSTIQRVLARFARLLAGVVDYPEAKLSELPLIAPEELSELDEAAGKTRRRARVGDETVRALFEESVAAGPERVAVTSGDDELSYGELDRRANGIAWELRRRGMGADDVVGVLLPRSTALLVSLVGTAKNGSAYLALDESYPEERLRFLVSDSKVRCVLTERELWKGHDGLDASLEPLFVEEVPARERAPESSPAPDSLLYVTYTSGSTGVPKGVEVTHRAVVRLVKGQDYVRLDAESRLLQLAPVSFDASTFEIWGALANGGRVVLYPERVPTAQELEAVLQRTGVTALWLTGALFNALVDESPACLASVSEVIAGGEALSVAHIRRAQKACPETTFVNGYGPTEGTTFTTCHRIPREPPDAAAGHPSIPIGRVLSGSLTYVLDPHGNRAPIGVPGELFIGGVGLARGYRARPELTGERFLPDPFAGVPGARMYRTGDRVRILPDGTFDYLGRLDRQVKLRGYRVEPGEVEAALTSHPSVLEAAVMVGEDERGERRLLGYVVLAPESPQASARPTTDELRDSLSDRLPEYMVPQALLELEALPRTPNGKLDRDALPRPDWGASAGLLGRVAPRGPLEESLAEIWMELLGLEHVGVHDDFFDLGGHSLLAAQLMSRVRKAFRCEIPLRSLFLAPTISALARQIEETLGAGLVESHVPLERIPRDVELPLSFSQKRLWFLYQLEPKNTAYNIATGGKLGGPLDVAALERSLDRIVARHESLRTTFGNLDGRPVVTIHATDEQAFSLTQVDLEPLDRKERDAALRRVASEEAERPFDLATGPLFRGLLVRLSAGEHVLLLTMHHIVSDGWSMGILYQELWTLYRGLVRGEAVSLAELPIQYVDYAHWQRRWLHGERLRQELHFWRETLRDLPQLVLPTDHPRPTVQTFRGARLRTVLGSDLTARLRALARREGVTTFMLLLALFQALLKKYSGQNDVVVGTPIANRSREEIEGLVGFFVNNLVLRTDLSGEPTFRELLVRVREVAVSAYAHQQLPFEKLVEELSPDRDMSRNPLFQVTYVHEVGRRSEVSPEALEFSGIDLDLERAHFDLSLFTYESESALTALLEYNVDLFEEPTIERMLRHFHRLAEQVIARPDESLAALSMLSDSEERQLLSDWAVGPRPPALARTETLEGVFSEIARRSPDNIALDFDDARLTYRELDLRANRLAHYLRGFALTPETPVGVLLERSAQAIVALLAVVKAGGFYVPLDPTYPDERLDFLVRDSGGSLVLTQQSLRHRIPSAASRVVYVDLDGERIDEQPEGPPPSWNEPESLAYAIYTSGSTGEPKGVAVSHRAVLRLVREPSYVALSETDRIAQASSLSFDAATFEIWGALLHGAALVGIAKEVALAPEDFGRELSTRGVTTLWLTTSLFNAIVDDGPEILSPVKQLLVGGEALSPPHITRALQALPDIELVNGYGPTEGTTFTCCYPIPRSEELLKGRLRSIPIGRPIVNTRVYLLDEDRRPVPVGVAGELFVSGDGLARGYLARPELTAEAFVPHPFAEVPGERLYRTGDRARYLPNGDIEFLGRIDAQVKIRGFRVELGEITAVLATHDNVREAVVLDREDEPGVKRLVAYVVANRRPVPSTAALRSHLQDRLPDFMIPQSFVLLDELPLTANGKLDRRALPLPERLRPSLKARFEPPRTELERQVASLWKELLGLDAVGIHDSFFDLGGHSLLMAELHGKLRKRFGIEVEMVKLFQYPTVASLAERLRPQEFTAEAPDSSPASSRKIDTIQQRVERQKEALSRRKAALRSRSKS